MAPDKAQALDAIKRLAADAHISSDEIVTAMTGISEPRVETTLEVPMQPSSPPPGPLSHNLNATGVFAYIGAMIVVIGLSFLIGQNWQDLGTALRLILTLGVGVGFYATATYLMVHKQYERAASAFHIIAAYALSAGAGVFLFTINMLDNRWACVVAVAVLVALYAVTDYVLRRVVLSFFTIVFATALFWVLIFASDVVASSGSADAIMYGCIVVGGAYLALAYAWQGTWRGILKGALATFGALFVLAGAYALSFGENFMAIIWTLAFPGLLATMFYGSTKLRSGGMFVVAVLWMVSFIFTVTARYFAMTIGWPIALMFAGLMLIAAGYFVVAFKNKYLGGSK